MYAALDLAKYIAGKCIEEQHPITNLQLQKILFYIQREFLQKLDKRAFPENIEAWPFGPVVPKVYYYFCGAGGMPITLCSKPNLQFEIGDKSIIDSIIETKRTLKAWDLVTETHKPNGAWDTVFNKWQGNRKIIPIKSIKELG